MPDPIGQRLVDLYGPHAGARTADRLRDRMREVAPKIRPPGRPLSEQDAILITYGDQIRTESEPPLRTLAEFCHEWLEDVVSGIHILPFYPSSSDDGFAVIDYTAVDPELGSWDDLSPLGARFDLMFDAVFNHMSAQSLWFRRFLDGDDAFREFFVTIEGSPNLSQVVRPRALPLLTRFPSATGPRQVWTTFSADQVDLNYKNPDVFLRVTDVLFDYIVRRTRFIRLDAIAYLWKEPGTSCIHLPQTHRIIQLWRAILDDLAPGVRLITETNVPHIDNIAYFGDGTNEAHLVYNFALPPLVLHALLRQAGTHLARWVQQLELPSTEVAFFNFLASHDGIGLNPALGILPPAEISRLIQDVQTRGGFVSEKHNPDGTRSPYELNINYLDALVDPNSTPALDLAIQRFLVAHAILLSFRGVPALYFHSLFGSRGDRAGAVASGIPRRINRQKLSRASVEADLLQAGSVRHSIFPRLRHMLRIRRGHPAFHPAAPQAVLGLDPRLFILRRGHPDSPDNVWCLHNLSASFVELTLPPIFTAFASRRIDLLTGCHLGSSGLIRLKPFQILWAAIPHLQPDP
jgi:glucosylglycerate phosphorylase